MPGASAQGDCFINPIMDNNKPFLYHDAVVCDRARSCHVRLYKVVKTPLAIRQGTKVLRGKIELPVFGLIIIISITRFLLVAGRSLGPSEFFLVAHRYSNVVKHGQRCRAVQGLSHMSTEKGEVRLVSDYICLRPLA